MSNERPLIRSILLAKYHRHPSPRFLANAVDLARRCAARLTFADVLEDGDRIDPVFQTARLRELESSLSPHLQGTAADYRLLTGDLETAVGRVADDFDLVFLAENEPASESSDHEIRRLLRHSRLPVWLDGGADHAPRRILAAVDVLTRDPDKLRLNRPILERAILLAAVFGAELNLLAVQTLAGPLEIASRLVGASRGRDWKPSEIRKRLEEAVSETSLNAPRPEREPRLLIAEGDPADAIAETAGALGVDLLVAGCVGRTGLAAWLVGDTAERLSRRLDCSILAVKPTPEPSSRSVAQSARRAA